MFDVGANYLAAGDHLISVLEEIPEFKKVYSTNDLAELEERSQVTPAAHVIYFGDSIPESAQGGALTHVVQQWFVFIVVRQGTGATPNKTAGELIKKVLDKLHSKNMVPELGNLNRITSPAKPKYRSGFAYYPLAFNLKFRQKGERS